VQSYDSTFGLEPTDIVCLHMNSVQGCYGGLPANPFFNDNDDYWRIPDPLINHRGWSSVPVPKTGTTIRVLNSSAEGNFMQVHVNK
jgi:immune inhibitor A